jgi:tRNA pseudouridine38-40 synthase
VRETTPARIAARDRLVRPPRRPTDGAPPVGDRPRRFRAVVAYDGSDYAGWQRQRDLVSVQEVLEAALEAATGLPVTLAAAGRTDAGVHAEGQVVAFDSRTLLPASALRHLCDHVLPDSLRVRVVEEAPEGFDPQRACVRKLYRYLVRTSPAPAPAWRAVAFTVPGPLDVARMREAASHLVGTHDFRSFRNDPGPERRGEDTVRTLERLSVDEALGLVRIEAEGPGFLYMMVRNLAAALLEAGSGRRPPAWAGEVLRARDRTLLPPPAPPGGLSLVRVDYEPAWPVA